MYAATIPSGGGGCVPDDVVATLIDGWSEVEYVSQEIETGSQD
jgi:hypothetical protein